MVEGELLLEKQAAPFRIKTASLSLNGCYIPMMFTLEVGTKVKLSLWIKDAKISTEGLVVSRHLNVGNGIRFTGMVTDDNARLRGFLEAVA
jgi:hypothetical protein